jgi:hypothetical protein
MRSSLEDLRTLEGDLAKQGYVTFFPVPLEAEDHDPFADALHLIRIVLASRLDGVVFVVPKPDGTLGVSTKREMELADMLNMTTYVAIGRSITAEGLNTYLTSTLAESGGFQSLQALRIPDWVEDQPDLKAVIMEHSRG